MPARPCLGCGVLVTARSYCTKCRPRNGSTRHWRSMRLRVLHRDGYRCTHVENGERCIGVDDLHVDHVVPLSRGGADSMDNLTTLCSKHNLEKGDR